MRFCVCTLVVENLPPKKITDKIEPYLYRGKNATQNCITYLTEINNLIDEIFLDNITSPC